MVDSSYAKVPYQTDLLRWLKKMSSQFNQMADYWHYTIGANVIPADTVNKITYFEWSAYEDGPIEDEKHGLWKNNGEYEKGMAVMAGFLYRGEHKEKYLALLTKNKNELMNFFHIFRNQRHWKYWLEKQL